MKNKLKIGVMVDSIDVMPIWAYKMLEEVISDDNLEISQIIINNEANIVRQKEPLINRLKANLPYLLYIKYRQYEEKKYSSKNDAFIIKSISSLVETVDKIYITPKSKGYFDIIDEISDIEKAKLDVIIRLGFRILKGKILQASKYGIWSYHHGDNRTNRGGPAGVWEVIKGWDETGVILQVLSDELDGGRVLMRSVGSTNKLGIKHNLNSFYWKASKFIPMMLKKLYQNGEEWYYNEDNFKDEYLGFYSKNILKTPKNMAMFFGILRIYMRRLYEKTLDTFFIDQWVLFYHYKSNTGRIAKSLYKFKPLIPSKDRFWADPFIILHENKYFLFFEELIFKENIGKLAVAEISKSGELINKKQILQNVSYHLSFPFVFRYNNDYYLVPESENANEIQLFKSSNFPYEWVYSHCLMNNVRAADTIIHYINNKFWMWTTISHHPLTKLNDELYLFYSDNLFTNNWVSHPQNPIVTNAGRARNAGKIIEENGKLYRPAQDCIKSYGNKIKIMEIIKITTNEYIEVEADRITPDWTSGLSGTHTINHDVDMTIVDARMRKFAI
jgi:hypothetical protein